MGYMVIIFPDHMEKDWYGLIRLLTSLLQRTAAKFSDCWMSVCVLTVSGVRAAVADVRKCCQCVRRVQCGLRVFHGFVATLCGLRLFGGVLDRFFQFSCMVLSHV